MFIDVKILTRLMKKAYSGRGLFLEGYGEGITIASDYWGVWVDREAMPNKLKAAVVEYAGELPEEGKAYKCYKEQNEKVEMKRNAYDWISIQGLEQNVQEIHFTNLYYLHKDAYCNVMQADNGAIVLVNQVFESWYSRAQMDDEEQEPFGPRIIGNMIYWDNGTCKAIAFTRTNDGEEEVKEKIKNLENNIWY